jgi:hypothetical protein
MMKQIHAVLRLLICLLLTVAYAKQPPPASPEHDTGAAAVTDGRLLRADADAVLDDVDFSSLEVTRGDGRNL